MTDKIQKLLNEAEKLVNDKGSYLRRLIDSDSHQNKLELAIEKYDKAIGLLKLEKGTEKEAKIISARLSKINALKMLRDSPVYQISQEYESIAEKSPFEDAIKYYTCSCDLNIEAGNDARVMRIYENIAKLYDKNGDKNKALEYFMKIYESIQESTNVKVLDRIAQLLVLNNKYEDAIDMYEVIANKMTNINKYSVRDYLMNALLCDLCNSKIIPNDRYQRYNREYPVFESSEPEKFMVNIFDAIENKSLEKFNESVCRYNAIYTLDDLRVKLLSECKEIVEGYDPNNVDDPL